jgi:PKD repeat protein
MLAYLSLRTFSTTAAAGSRVLKSTGIAGCVLAALLIIGCEGTNSDTAPANGAGGNGAVPLPAELQSQLQAEFARLGIIPDKVSQAAPLGEGNAVFDLQAGVNTGTPASIVLSWTERALGDYNQDGLVSINDLTPVGQRYNETVAHDDPADHDGLDCWPTGDPDGAGADNWRLARIDGNDDGLVYLSDITTIAQHWNERLDGYRLYFKEPGAPEFSMYPDPDDAEAPVTVARSAVAPTEANSPYRYSVAFELTVFEGEFQFYVAPYDSVDEQVGTPSAILTLTLPQGQPPTADLTADVTAGNPPLNVNFDASASSDPEGELISYNWDFDGDGTYDEQTTEPTAAHEYPTGGTFAATVRVEDAEHQLDTASLDIVVNQAPTAVLSISPPEPTVVPFTMSFSAAASSDPDGTIVQYDYDWGSDGDFDLIDGGPEPVSSYTMTLPGDYPVTVRVTDNQGLTDTDSGSAVGLYGEWQTQTIAGNDGTHCSLALVDGNPAISYHDSHHNCLAYIRATDPFGIEAWGEPLQLNDEMGDEGTYTSLAVINSNPAIAFYDSTDQQGLYIRANDAQGSSWPSAAKVIRGESSYYLSLAEAAGRPAVAYQTSMSNIVYERASDINGDSWIAGEMYVDETLDTCHEPSLAIVNGNPAIAYVQITDGVMYLAYVAATDPSGTQPWQQPVIAVNAMPEDAGSWPRLRQIGGNPAITFGIGDASILNLAPYYVRSTSSQGSSGSWEAPGPQALAGALTVRVAQTSVAGVGFYPHAVFQDQDTGTLWHAWSRNFVGSIWMDPVVVDGGDGLNYVGSYCDLKNINGRPAVAYHDSTNNTLKYAVLQ